MPNVTTNPADPKCTAISLKTKSPIKCTKWIYERTQLRSTIVTEFDLVCDRNYYFELAYSIEQIGYLLGSLIFSYLADIIGRKAVFVSVVIGIKTLNKLLICIKNTYQKFEVKKTQYFFVFGFIE